VIVDADLKSGKLAFRVSARVGQRGTAKARE